MMTKKEKKRVPELRFVGFEEEWEKMKLGDISSFYSGGTPSSTNKSYYSGDIPFIGSGNISDDYVSSFITVEALNSSSAKLVGKGDLLYALYGATSGEVAISNIDGAINQAVLCIKTNENKYYLYQLLKYNKNRIVSKFIQGGQGNLSASIIKELKFSFPSKEEQQKIATFLTTIDTRIQQLEKKKTLLEQYKKGVMQKIFSQEIRFKPALSGVEVDDDGKEFGEWEEKRIGDISTFFSGGTPRSTNRSFYNGNIPFIGSGNISDESVDSYITTEALNSSSAKLVEKGDLLYALYGATSGEVAISKMKGAINQAVLCIRTNANKYYLYQLLKYNKDKIVETYIQGGQGNLSAAIIKDLKFKLPCLEEQTKIAHFLSALDRKIAVVDEQIEGTKEWKKGLLQRMFV